MGLHKCKEQNLPALSADVWTGWTSGDSLHQKNNIVATKHLLGPIVGDFVKYLNKHPFSIFQLHAHGINVRHLALVKKKMEKDVTTVKQEALIQIFARTIKNDLQHKLRIGTCSGKSISEHQISIIEYINLFLGVKSKHNISKKSEKNAKVPFTLSQFW